MGQKTFFIKNRRKIKFLLGAKTTIIYDSNGNNLSDFILTEWVQGDSNAYKRIFLYQQKKKGRKLKLSKSIKKLKAINPIIKTGDLNNDGLKDLVIYDLGKKIDNDPGYTGMKPVVYFGRKNKRLVKSNFLAKAYSTYASNDSWQTDSRVSAKDFALADIDNDGDLDIWVESSGGMNVTNHFAINHGSHFTIEKGRIPEKDIQGPKKTDFNRYWKAHFEDLNSNGSQDLILGQSRTDDITHINGSSIILKNNKKGFFKLKRRLPKPRFNKGFTVVGSIATGDLNNDGRKDIILAHRRPGNKLKKIKTNPGTGNYIQALIQSKKGRFKDRSKSILGAQGKWSKDKKSNTNFISKINFFDANNDGSKDLLINYESNFDIVGPTLLINKKGKKLRRIRPNAIKNYSGGYNFAWNKDELSEGRLMAMTQISNSKILTLDNLLK